MRTHQIRYFLKLVDSMNFTQAAKEAGVSQPTLTRSIQRLEEMLGGRLLYRDGKDTRLTALGEAVRAEFEKIVDSEEKIRQITRENEEGTLEKLRIGIVSTVAPLRLSRIINDAMKRMPSSEVVLHPINAHSGIELVLAGSLDGCFVATEPPDNPKLAVAELFDERLMLGCSKEHPFAKLEKVPTALISGQTYVDRLNCEFRESVINYLEGKTALPEPRLRSEREDWLQEVVAMGGGITMVPEFSIISNDIELKPVEGIDLTRTIRFVSISGSGASNVLQDFRKMLRNEVWLD